MKHTLLILLTGTLLSCVSAPAQDKDAKPTGPPETPKAASGEPFPDLKKLDATTSGEDTTDAKSTVSGGGLSGGGGGFSMPPNMSGFGGGFGGGGSFSNRSLRRMVSAQNIIISWPKENDELRGFSLSKGTWTNLKVPPQAGIMPVISSNVAAVKITNGMAAFSGERQNWAVLPLPKGSKALPVLSDNLVTVYEGDHIYTFAANSGRWTSPTDLTLAETSKTLPALPRNLDPLDLDVELKRLNLSLMRSGNTQTVSGTVADIAKLEEFLAKNDGSAGPSSRNKPTSGGFSTSESTGNSQFTFPSTGTPLPPPGTERISGFHSTQKGQDFGTSSPMGLATRRGHASFPAPDAGPGVMGPGPFGTSDLKNQPRFSLPKSISTGRPSSPTLPGLFHTNSSAAKAEQASLKLAEILRNKQQKKELSTAERSELRELVTSALDQRLKAQQKSIQDLRKKLEAVEGKMKNKLENKEKMIDRRVDELLNPDLDWNSVSAKAAPLHFTTRGFGEVKGTNHFRSGPVHTSNLGAQNSNLNGFFSHGGKETLDSFGAPSDKTPEARKDSPAFPSNQLNDFSDMEKLSSQLPNELDGKAEQLESATQKLRTRAQSMSKLITTYRGQLSKEQQVQQKMVNSLADEGDTIDREAVSVSQERTLKKIDLLKKAVDEQEVQLKNTMHDWNRLWNQIKTAADSQTSRVEIATMIADRCRKDADRQSSLAERGLVPMSAVESARIKKKLADLQLKTHQDTLAQFRQILSDRPELNPASLGKGDMTESSSGTAEQE